MNDQTRNLAWKLNWFRQSELEGSLLLGRMVGTVEDHHLAKRLTKHCAEEAEHSRIWSDVIAELCLPHIRIFRSYQSFYLQKSGPPATLLEVLAFTQIFERRVHRRFHEELRDPEMPVVARSAFVRMMEDEKDHLAWVADWLRTQAGAHECLRTYEDLDAAVLRQLLPFEKTLWAIPGLGWEQIDTAPALA
ncbi:MAG TPA: ferritin-like domain-containing protein [Chthoniobacter sp.]|nr:ferritin-like domain-containing protein [Chthoniobacter sp.]